MGIKTNTFNITIDDEIADLKRELEMRKKVYPGQIERGKLSKDQANKRYLCTQNTLRRLEKLKKQMDVEQKSLDL